jgi:hypothetical protein
MNSVRLIIRQLRRLVTKVDARSLIAFAAAALAPVAALAGEWTAWRWITPLPQGHDLYAVARGAGETVAVGPRVVLRSEDGGGWSVVEPAVPGAFMGVVWTGERYVACGAAGSVQVSDDGRRWSEVWHASMDYGWGARRSHGMGARSRSSTAGRC